MKCGGGDGNRDTALEAMGIIAEIEPEEPTHFGVHPGNAEAVGWFMRMQRRWVVSEMSGHYVRLDDTAVAAQMDMRGVKKKHRAKLLDQLMVMESAALEILNKT